MGDDLIEMASADKVEGQVMGQGPFGIGYYLRGALAGGICCSITHGAACPIDVVKTRMQLDPVKYNKGLIGGFRQVIAEEGAIALSTGFGPTAQGYFVQGWFKFGGVEFFKINFTKSLGEQKAWDNKTPIYLLSAACAEFIADVFLCPYEACRIRLVSDPKFASSMADCGKRMVAEGGVIGGLYAGFVPMLFKQIPYTMAKFAVQGKCADLISKINKAGAGGTGSLMTRLSNIASETGYAKLCTQGLPARCIMIGSLTAGQFGIFDTVMGALGAAKFHFHDPSH